MSSVGIDGNSTAHTPEIHARKFAAVPALCGAPAGRPWTTTRAFVTCRVCAAEISRRLAARSKR